MKLITKNHLIACLFTMSIVNLIPSFGFAEMRTKVYLEKNNSTLSTKIDKSLFGKWILKTEKSTNILANGTTTERIRTTDGGNIKEYNKDGTFIITKHDYKFITGTYCSANKQILENIINAQNTSLEGTNNALIYKIQKRRKILIVKYQLPNSTSIIEEEWHKI